MGVAETCPLMSHHFAYLYACARASKTGGTELVLEYCSIDPYKNLQCTGIALTESVYHTYCVPYIHSCMYSNP